MRIFTDQSELSTKDIATLKNITHGAAINVRAYVRKKLGKPRRSAITYAEYKEVYGILTIKKD